jgi:hypothetical protein
LTVLLRRSYDKEIIKLISDDRDSGSKKYKRVYGCAYVGLDIAESALSGSLESGGQFCVGAFGRNLASVTVNMFLHLICF